MLTIGFARRVATYKRLDLLLRDVDRALALLGDADRPVQLILAGKAHPRDDDGKRLVQRLFEMKAHIAGRPPRRLPRRLRPRARRRDGARLRHLGQRAAPAAGGVAARSGIKSAVNGGLQLSVLDGWWPEAYDGTNGWAIGGEVDADHGAQDWRHAAELYRLLLRARRCRRSTTAAATGCPAAGSRWSARRCGRSARSFGAGRMIRDYVERIYPPGVAGGAR